jgi:hypothetical protein
MLDIFLGEFLGLLVFVVVHGGILASMVLTGKAKEGIEKKIFEKFITFLSYYKTTKISKKSLFLN